MPIAYDISPQMYYTYPFECAACNNVSIGHNAESVQSHGILRLVLNRMRQVKSLVLAHTPTNRKSVWTRLQAVPVCLCHCQEMVRRSIVNFR